jgi:hypothetical protein
LGIRGIGRQIKLTQNPVPHTHTHTRSFTTTTTTTIEEKEELNSGKTTLMQT